MKATNNNPQSCFGDNVALKKPLVLVVEDEQMQRIILRASLERNGFAVLEAVDGRDGLRVFDRLRPDIVLLDVCMPEMDGYEACRALRQRPGAEQMPILMLTVHDDVESIQRAYEAGATDFMAKPVSWPLLGHRLRYMLRATEAFHELARSEAELLRHVAERTVKLQETNARLESANTDLEAFILSVTHELRAPLRAVRGYAGLLKGNTTAPDAVLIDHIIDRTEHMSSMINNLLRLSRISRSGELSLQTVDLDAMVRKVAGTLQRDYPNARVSIAPLPTVTCDAGLMEQALENLVDNALKYSSRVATPQISIGVEDHAGERAFFVRDNGAGFDTQRARTLFGVFQRFHAESEFSGTGVGLAIVKRILERHHGRIWAQSQPDQGATFWFTLGMPPIPDPRRPS